MNVLPLYRLQGHGDHFYTTSAAERDNAISQFGYTSEGIACYVLAEPPPADPAPPLPPPVVATVSTANEYLAQCATQILASIITGRFHAGHYADLDKNMPSDIACAMAAAKRMLASLPDPLPR